MRRVYPEQLSKQLIAGFNACYLLFGDEPLLRQESQDLIWQAAQQQGFYERLQFQVDAQLNWQNVFDVCQELSLFSNRQLLELQLAKAPDQKIAKQLTTLRALLHPDIIVVLIGPRLTLAQQNSVWLQEFASMGPFIPILHPEGKQFFRWMKQRFQAHHLTATDDAIALMCHAFEGNLLAARQTLELLSLYDFQGPINAAILEPLIEQQNHFSRYQLADALYQGKTKRALRILNSLHQEDVEASALIWQLAHELEQLFQLALLHQKRQSLQTLYKKLKIWPKRQQLIERILQHLSTAQISNLLGLCAEANQAAARFDDSQCWRLLEQICIGFRHPTLGASSR